MVGTNHTVMTKQLNFNPLDYFEMLAKQNVLCRKNEFMPVFCSGPDNIEGLMAEYRTTENFIVIDDTTDNNVHNNKPGWFTKSVYTVWILASTRYNDPERRKERMKLCREIFRQFLSRMLNDKAKMVYGQAMYYMDLSRIYYKELGRYSFNGATGLYFMVENDIPENLIFVEDEWDR